jgi:CRISPR-associated endonuclease/helicase Cas3
MTTIASWISNYWGKAAFDVADGPLWHPLAYHALDVAAVALIYLKSSPRLLADYSARLGTAPESALSLLVLCMAWHDLGKFGDNFQLKRPDLDCHRSSGRRLDSPYAKCSYHHDSISLSIWDRKLAKLLSVEVSRLGGLVNDPLAEEPGLRELLIAAFGHHGTPPVSLDDYDSAIGKSSIEAVLDFCRATFDLLSPGIHRFDPAVGAVTGLSWDLAGLAVLADWIGSNRNWFPYQFPNWALEDYWKKIALPAAEFAVDQSGILAQRCRPVPQAGEVFPHLKGKALRPAQDLVASLDVSGGPQLFVIEDATGSGKTEAAFLLTAKLMAAGLADGFFFALPTQATADQMFERVSLQLPTLFFEPHKVSCVLAHGARDQNPWYKKLRESADSPDCVAGEASTASFSVSEWLAHSNKRALIAQIGAGTVDQAMLAALMARHQSLRLFGLARKVLIVDEVHSYDDYVTRILEGLLRGLAELGASVILLSATLHSRTRASLIQAFAKGRRIKAPRLELVHHYPMLSRFGNGVLDQLAFEHALHAERKVRVEYTSGRDELYARIAAWLLGEQCVVWIRNTVGDALDAYDYWKAQLGEDCILFHSRFAQCDRARIQNRVLMRLGKNSSKSCRAGLLVIATQVLSQSLDLDADQMVSDLAPIDEILQRQGRLRRHARNLDGQVIDDAPDQRGAIALTIFGPSLDGAPSANWYSRFSRGAARVYPQTGRLWLAALALKQGLTLPQDFRALVEHVYSATEPECFSKAEQRVAGENTGKRIAAQDVLLRWDDGYCSNERWSDERKVLTRLGNSVEAVMVSVDAEVPCPWPGQVADAVDPWATAAIRVPDWWLGDAAGAPDHADLQSVDAEVAAAIASLRLHTPALRYRLMLPLRSDGDSFLCQLQGLTLKYDPERGLSREIPAKAGNR